MVIDGQWLMVDCGVSFNEPVNAGYLRTSENSVRRSRFISEQKDVSLGIVITHAHEDHGGRHCLFYGAVYKMILVYHGVSAEVLASKIAASGVWPTDVPVIVR